jgi:hypothetical protein
MGGGLHRLPLILLLCVPWHLRLTAQPLLLVQLAQLLDFVAQLLNPDANFFQFWPIVILHFHGRNATSLSL